MKASVAATVLRVGDKDIGDKDRRVQKGTNLPPVEEGMDERYSCSHCSEG